jgi:DNA-binding NarL/FixJ family response regulator
MRLLILDDQPIVTIGVQLYAKQWDFLTAVQGAHRPQDAAKLIAQGEIDLLLLDPRIGHQDGLSLMTQFLTQHPPLLVIIFSALNPDPYAVRCYLAGAKAFVPKTADIVEVYNALVAVRKGELYYPGDLTRLLLRQSNSSSPSAPTGIDLLSDRELHLFRLIGTGSSTRQSSAQMNLSIKTVESHRRNIMTKLRLVGAHALVAEATRWCLLQHG